MSETKTKKSKKEDLKGKIINVDPAIKKQLVQLISKVDELEELLHAQISVSTQVSQVLFKLVSALLDRETDRDDERLATTLSELQDILLENKIALEET